ncbi:MAG: hypothetical protein ABIH71_06550 [Candidatus Omnitrophota bacterium]
MKLKPNDPPREFEAGFDIKRMIKDCGKLELNADEQITFTTESGVEYDLTRKNFGFYATPSINGRLVKFNLRAVLVKNRIDRIFMLLVEKGKEDLFDKYMNEEKMDIIGWFDDPQFLLKIKGDCK